MNGRRIAETVKLLRSELWPRGLDFHTDETWRIDGAHHVVPSIALLIWKGHLTDWLIGEGYHSFNYVMEGDGEHVTLELYDKTYRVRMQSGVDTTLALLVQAVMELSAEVRQ